MNNLTISMSSSNQEDKKHLTAQSKITKEEIIRIEYAFCIKLNNHKFNIIIPSYQKSRFTILYSMLFQTLSSGYESLNTISSISYSMGMYKAQGEPDTQIGLVGG